MKFSQAKFIVYSTCSVHEEEDEVVVRDALAKSKEWKLVDLKEVFEGEDGLKLNKRISEGLHFIEIGG